MKRFIKVFFVFIALFLLLNAHIPQLNSKISNSQILNHFISQSDNNIEKISIHIDIGENYLVKSNNFSETIAVPRKQNELGFNFANDFAIRLKDNYKILYKNSYNNRTRRQ